jgi:hypothetical protein
MSLSFMVIDAFCFAETYPFMVIDAFCFAETHPTRFIFRSSFFLPFLMTTFTADVFQNRFLPEGANEVHAIMTVTASQTLEAAMIAPPANGDRVFGIICDTSGSMQGDKIQAAKTAMRTLVEMLPEDSKFFIITGSSGAKIICPTMQATTKNKQEAINAIRGVSANGGTVMSRWLSAALDQFRQYPNAIRQALLLTDGQNDSSDDDNLITILQKATEQFQCHCRGVGTDWRVAELQRVAAALMGTTDIIPDPSLLEADFQEILTLAMSKSIQDVRLRLWTPQGAIVRYCKLVSPEIVDVTPKGQSPKPQTFDYPTGAWAKDESRDYHFCIEVKPGNVGDEMLAGRASLISTIDGQETKIAEAKILAVWTDDEARSAKIDRRVAHYTGQAELATSIQEGIEARERGDVDVATAKLGRAVQLAHESGNEATAKLLRTVVEVEDEATGTVRLKRSVEKVDEMMLETRSTKTTRLPKT